MGGYAQNDKGFPTLATYQLEGRDRRPRRSFSTVVGNYGFFDYAALWAAMLRMTRVFPRLPPVSSRVGTGVLGNVTKLSCHPERSTESTKSKDPLPSGNYGSFDSLRYAQDDSLT